jgi:hypothetical protein
MDASGRGSIQWRRAYMTYRRIALVLGVAVACLAVGAPTAGAQ